MTNDKHGVYLALIQEAKEVFAEADEAVKRIQNEGVRSADFGEYGMNLAIRAAAGRRIERYQAKVAEIDAAKEDE